MADLSTLDDLLPAETDAPDATVDLGRRIASALVPGDVVVLIGDLGTGKTHLVSGVTEGRGGRAEDVTSPTFTIAHEYDTDPPVYHLDLYRLSGPDEVRASGVADYLEREGICLIEWPERAGALLPPDSVVLRLTHAGGDRRRIERVAVSAPSGDAGRDAADDDHDGGRAA